MCIAIWIIPIVYWRPGGPDSPLYWVCFAAPFIFSIVGIFWVTIVGFVLGKGGENQEDGFLEQEIDLKDSNLQGADLREANLQGAELVEANLKGADLWGANLQRANLILANLKRAKLIQADLEKANFTSANLHGADLSEANLHKTVLQFAKYTDDTKWPHGFDPIAAGAIRIED